MFDVVGFVEKATTRQQLRRDLSPFQRNAADLISLDDLVQETISRALAARASFRGDRPEQCIAWMRRIGKNVVTDAQRKNQIEKAKLPMVAKPDSVPPEPQDSTSEEVELAFLSLSSVDARLVNAIIAGLPFKEAASILEITEEAARKRYSRAMQKLAMD